MSHNDEALQDDSLDGVERELLEGEAARLCSDDAGVNREAARLVVDRFRAHERQRRMLVAAGSVLSLAAAAALLIGLRQRGADEPSGVHSAQKATSSPLVVESGSVLVSGELMARGETVAAGTPVELAPHTCLRAGKTVRLCANTGARLKLPAFGAAWDVELSAGGITADLEAMPAGFSIRTLHGTASVVGTRFSVELEASQAFTTVSVERGRVRVKHRLGPEGFLDAGERARLGEGLELSSGSHEPLPLPSMDAFVPAPGEAPAAARQGATLPEGAPKTQTAGDLLEAARQQRGSRHYVQAAQLYRKLVEQHPESAEARAALVSLGQLELGQLGQPEAALRSFQAYLARPGQLRQEAEHGQIQALQKLGRKAEERRAIEAFLGRYPKSTQAGPLSERLKQL